MIFTVNYSHTSRRILGMKTILKVVCMYCGRHIEDKDGEGVEGISHGLCMECLEAWLKERRAK